MDLDPDDIFRDDEDDPENDLYQVFFIYVYKVLAYFFLVIIANSICLFI